MAGIQDFIEFTEDFLGPQTVLASPVGSDRWDVAITGAAPPTATVGGINGELTLAHTSDAQVQIVSVFQSDVLNYDIDTIQRIEFRAKTVATLDSTTSLAFGVASARNDAVDSIAAHASFRLIGSNAIVVESDDGTTDKDDIATGATLVATYKKFVIDFTGGKSDVKFYVDGTRVAASTTFDMSAYSSGLQPYVQLQKSSDTNADTATIDYIKIVSKRA